MDGQITMENIASGGSSPGERVDTRFSTPAPELDDHRPRPARAYPPSPLQPRVDGPRLDIPSLEVHEATPRGSTVDPHNLLQVDSALRNLSDPGLGQSIARDFEHAIVDTEGEEDELVSPLARVSSNRRDTTRGRRPRGFRQQDRSRETSSSSSRSTSPANSIEAFAEPRRRQRANTVGSLPDSIDWQRARAGSYTERRPTLSNISAPDIKSRTRTDRDDDSIKFDIDEEPGNTYKIDFEELEEFVALCNKGLIGTESQSSEGTGTTKVFLDQTQRPDTRKAAIIPNVPLNPETFYEKPLDNGESSGSDDKPEEKQSKAQKTEAIRSLPDRFTFFSSDLQQARCARTLGGFVQNGTKFQDLFDVGPEGGVWWLDVLNPTKAELDVIASAFRIHRLTKEDIEMQEPREKVELFSQYYFVCFRSFNMDHRSEDFLDPIHIYIIVTTDGVLSFSYTPNPHAKNVRKRISKLGDFVSLGPDYICYALIDDIVDSFAPIIRNEETESENIEDQVFIARDEDFSALLKQIGDARKRVLNMMRLLGGKADVIKGFAKRCNEQFEMTPRGDIGLYLGDIQDHVVTMMSNLGHVEKMLSRSHANYLAQLNVDHLLKGNSTNKALAKITVVATILVPLNLITGLFGMNVHVPGAGVDGYAWFGGILGAIGLVVTVSLFVAKRLKLI